MWIVRAGGQFHPQGVPHEPHPATLTPPRSPECRTACGEVMSQTVPQQGLIPLSEKMILAAEHAIHCATWLRGKKVDHSTPCHLATDVSAVSTHTNG